MPDLAGRIGSANDFNNFGFRLDAGQYYAIWVTGIGSDPLDDAILTLRRGGRVVAQDDDSGPGADPLLFFLPPSSGKYSVRVDGSGASTGDYRLSVQMDDYRNSPDGDGPAAFVRPGGTMMGRISYETDTDMIGVRLKEGLTYVFFMRGEATGDGRLPDPTLSLLNRNGVLLESDDDSGTGTNARFVYTAAYSGQHWLAAEGFDANIGSYTVTVSRGAVPLSVPGHDDAPGGKPGPATDPVADDPGGLFADFAGLDGAADFLL